MLMAKMIRAASQLIPAHLPVRACGQDTCLAATTDSERGGIEPTSSNLAETKHA